MRKIIFILSLLTVTVLSAQIVNIPDANFKTALLNYNPIIDTNGDGEIQVSEAVIPGGLSLLNLGIIDMSGIEYFTNLVFLQCPNNQIATLDLTGLNNLENVSLTGNVLTSLNVTNLTNLRYLYINNNQLTTLDLSTNSTLREVYCTQNQIATLNVSSNPNLRELYIGNNPLNSLDVSSCISLASLSLFESNITTLDCSNNINLTGLDIAANTLLEMAFIKNGSDESSNMNNGNWMSNWDFSNNPNLIYVCADESQVVEIQSYAGTDYVVNSYCSFEPGGNYNTITGDLSVDQDNDGCDVNDSTFPYLKVSIDDGSEVGVSFTNDMGEYYFYTGIGSYTFMPDLENPTFFNSTPVDATVNFTNSNNNIATQDFCISPNGNHTDVEVVIAPTIFARPGFDAEYVITYKNKGNQIVSGNINFSFDDTVLDFISASETISSQNTGEINWNYIDLLPFESRSIYVTLNVNSPIETPAVNIDDVLIFNVSISPLADENSNDNQFAFDQVVVGSYDPNNIICLEGNNLPTSEIGEFLHYIINFENTGNFYAENIVVKTEIDPLQFDISTLRFLSSSHEVKIRINGDILEIIFQSVNLDPGGHGNILMKLETNDALGENDVVNNKSDIYFDYNFPIETNVEDTFFRTTLSSGENIISNSISLYPTIIENSLNIKSMDNIKNVKVFGIQGRLLIDNDYDTTELNLNVEKQNSGILIVKITTDLGVITEKVIKK